MIVSCLQPVKSVSNIILLYKSCIILPRRADWKSRRISARACRDTALVLLPPWPRIQRLSSRKQHSNTRVHVRCMCWPLSSPVNRSHDAQVPAQLPTNTTLQKKFNSIPVDRWLFFSFFFRQVILSSPRKEVQRGYLPYSLSYEEGIRFCSRTLTNHFKAGPHSYYTHLFYVPSKGGNNCLFTITPPLT